MKTPRKSTRCQASPLPGGVNSPVRAFEAVGGSPHFIASASGARITDIDGNTFIDYVGSWGPMIHGHAPRGLARALARQAQARHELRRTEPARSRARQARAAPRAVDRAHALRQLGHRGDDERGARGARRDRPREDRQVRGLLSRPRRRVSRAGGFGRADVRHADESRRPGRGGRGRRCSRATTTSRRSKRWSRANPAQIAAVIIEPVPGNMGTVLPEPGFLEGLRALCDREGMLLIFDEVMSGFRVARGRRAGALRRQARI